MKKTVAIFVLIATMLVFIVSSAPGYTAPLAAAPTSTPNPNGQISLPGVKIQLYVPGPNSLVNTPNTKGYTAGFLIGLFHGFISPGTLLVSFFNSKVQMYEVHNKGNLYNLGFFLGAVIIISFFAIFTRRRRV
jgi:hypothetical protein